ncbi:MAG: hypothetical protein NTZ40_10375 [Cyanobacteria bacterium]|nr:hypothetical protein [Cyanobacteriota bacterium]
MLRNFRCDTIQIRQWKRQLLDVASELLTRGKQIRDKEERQVKEAELFQQIGRLWMVLVWLKNIVSATLISVNYASYSITANPISASAGHLHCCV